MAITLEYSNSTDHTARNLAAQNAQDVRNRDAAAAAADLEWQRGFGAYQFAECRYNDLPNDDQRQGWRAAERAGAEVMVADWRELSKDITAEKGGWA